MGGIDDDHRAALDDLDARGPLHGFEPLCHRLFGDLLAGDAQLLDRNDRGGCVVELVLAEKGELDLDTPLIKYAPKDYI